MKLKFVGGLMDGECYDVTNGADSVWCPVIGKTRWYWLLYKVYWEIGIAKYRGKRKWDEKWDKRI